MVSKKILGAAIAAAVMASSSAFAVVDFNADSPAKSKIAKQALVKTGKQTVSSVDYYLVAQGAKVDTAFTVKSGIGISTGQKRWVRVSLTGGLFGAAAGALTGTTLNAIGTVTVVQGGNAKDAFVVYEVTGGSVGALQDEVLNIAAGNLLVPASGSIDVTYAIYSTIDGATAPASATPLSSKSVTGLVSIVDGLTATYTAGSTTADVDFSFKKILNVASTVRSKIGQLVLAANTDAAKDTGAVVTVPSMIDTAATKTVITGDFSVGTFSLSADDCTTATIALTPNTAKTSVEVTAAQLIAAPSLCIALADTTKVLNVTDYNAVTTVSAASDIAFAATVANGTVGSIAHNGTTIQVPYVTTFADYKQRLVLVNRSTADSAYAVTFTTETGVTATPGVAATGTLKAGTTTILPMSDVVSIVGATRTAATVVIAAPTLKIDAATTIVNTNGGGTDTVKLQ